MSFFGNILSKLGMGGSEEDVSAASSPATPSPDTTAIDSGAMTETAVAEKPAAISKVDVVAKLESMAASNPQNLNWKESIVDLLKLLDLDSSLGARKELAAELGCPTELMGDSAQMNVWLHKAVLQRLADNGGNIPGELL